MRQTLLLLTPNCEGRNSLDTTELYHYTPAKIGVGTTTTATKEKSHRGSPKGSQDQTDLGCDPGCVFSGKSSDVSRPISLSVKWGDHT